MSKAEDMVAPSGDGTNNTTVLALTLDTTARNIELPPYMYGEFIRLTPFGANVYWFISTSASAAVDRTTAAGATSALASAATRGSRLDNGSTIERLCGYARPGQKLYLCYQGSAAGDFLQIEKASGKPQAVTRDD
jgi:hypothetical protein